MKNKMVSNVISAVLTDKYLILPSSQKLPFIAEGNKYRDQEPENLKIL